MINESEHAVTRPFELPRMQYGLWYEVGQTWGPIAQAAVFVALCDSGYKMPNQNGHLDYCMEGIKTIAARRSILLH